MANTPISIKSRSWADTDEHERKERIIEKKEKIKKLIDDIFDEDDKLFARACLDKMNRLIINELNNGNPNPMPNSILNNQNQQSKIKFNPDSYKINFHCTTYHWISDCRPKSRIMIKSETYQVFCLKIHNEKPYLGLGENPTEWHELGLNDVIIEFMDEYNHETKLKVKLVKISTPVEV